MPYSLLQLWNAVEGAIQEENNILQMLYQTDITLRKKCFFEIVQEMSEENNLWFLFDYFAEAKTNSCCRIVCSRCQKTKKKKLSAALHLNAVFIMENKYKAIKKIYVYVFTVGLPSNDGCRRHR